MQIVFLTAFPLLAFFLVICIRKQVAGKLAFVISLAQLAYTGYLLSIYDFQHGYSLIINTPWVESLGISYKAGLDGISILMVLLTNFLIPFILVSAFKKDIERPGLFYGLVLLMQAGLIGVFTALDGFLFYVFWELALLPIYFLSALWGGANRIAVTFKFFLYTIIGSLFMLAGILYLYLQTPESHSFDIDVFKSLTLDLSSQTWLFLSFFIAFAIKMPVFPFHTWQPATYSEAPPQGTMLLSGIMLKMGVFGVIRWLLPLFPMAAAQWAMPIMILSVIGIVYGSIIAITQKDIKTLLAYSSFAHVGLICAGLFTGNVLGIQGAVIQMLSHGVTVVALFYLADILEVRLRTREIQAMGGLAEKAPRFATLFLIAVLGSVALPLTSGFVGEFLLLSSLFAYNKYIAVVAGLTIILGAVYMLRMYKRVLFGEANNLTTSFEDIKGADLLALAILALVILAIGIYPQPLLDISATEASRLTEILIPLAH